MKVICLIRYKCIFWRVEADILHWLLHLSSSILRSQFYFNRRCLNLIFDLSITRPAVLVLNEVDKLSREAQHSLRRTMEKYSSSCRLILCCNSSSKVTEAIRSRCLNIRINAPAEDQVRYPVCLRFRLCVIKVNLTLVSPWSDVTMDFVLIAVLFQQWFEFCI